jgi:RimJ/RimL family protein N-acetyltransferase
MRLRTERLTLRDLEEKDVDAVLAYRVRAPEKRPWLELSGECAEWPGYEEGGISVGASREEIRLAILLADSNHLIGACRIRFKDTTRLEAEVLFDFDPQYLKEGYASEAAAEILRAGFEELQLQRISSWCITSDALTGRVLRRVGMQVEDVLPRSRWVLGEWWDTLLYSIQKAEWVAQANEAPTDLPPAKRYS